MYYCNYYIDGQNYYSEVIANSQKDAVANAISMFGDTLEAVFESEKPLEETTMNEVKTFWIKGMASDVVTDKLHFNTKMFQDFLEGNFENVKRSLKNKNDEEIVMAIKAIINVSDIENGQQLLDLLQDTKTKEVMVNVFCAGMIENHMKLLDPHEALNVAIYYPELLKQKFDDDISDCYIGKSFKDLKKVYKKHEREILTVFGFGLYGSIMIDGGGLTDKAIEDIKKRQSDMTNKINEEALSRGKNET